MFIKNHQEIDFDSMFSDMLFNEIELFCKELNINEYNKDSLKIQHIWFNQYFVNISISNMYLMVLSGF